MADPKHVEYLLVALHAAYIMAEERFDHLALDYLRRHRAAGQLKAIKNAMLLQEQAYRLVLRGKPYLARLRLSGTVDNIAVMKVHDVAAVLDGLARLAGDSPAKKSHYW